MNIRLVANQFGLLLVVFGTAMLLEELLFVLFTSLGLQWLETPPVALDPTAQNAVLISAVIALATGGLLWFTTWRVQKKRGQEQKDRRERGRLPGHLGRREALLLVAVSWIIGAAFAGLPFFLWSHDGDTQALYAAIDEPPPFSSFVDCYFEAMSGLTTTGATVLSDIEAVPRSLLLWRSMTHWLGGLGIVVLFVAVFPSLGVGGKRLFQVEAPGPAPEGLQPQVRDTARVLLVIYGLLTAGQWLALMLAGMGPFDAICHTFGTLATGGFSTRNASVGAYGIGVRWVTIIFMVLAGMNFGLYYQLSRRKFRQVLHDPELRLYLLLLVAGSAIIFVTLARQPLVGTTGAVIPPSPAASATESIFTTVSIQTTTGFATTDFNTWPFLAQGVLVILMFIGGSSGSTGGGIKVIRIWIAFKVMLAEIEHVFRPSVIRPVRVGRGTVSDDLKLATVAYVLGVVVLFVAGAGLIMSLEQLLNPDVDCTFTSAATASVATLCTIGPGLGQVGAVENYGWFSPASKIVMCVLMALGRLEVFAIIVLFSHRFWRAS